jgi:hypothetical protein
MQVHLFTGKAAVSVIITVTVVMVTVTVGMIIDMASVAALLAALHVS